nr:hypothetical protein [Tanacetum cinerariifolium]
MTVNTKLVNASREKRSAKTHDPPALVANTYASSSSSRTPPTYYVTHPPLVIGYDDDYLREAKFCDDHEDSLTIAMMLFACAITQHYSTPTNNHLYTSLNTRNQKDTRNTTNAQRILRTTTNSGNGPNVQCYNFNAKGHYARECLNLRMNDFLLVDASAVKEFEELNATVCMMARIQQVGSDSDNEPIYDFDFINEVSE